jgi:aminomethyltransferase
MLENRKGSVTIENLSEQYAQLALQGPKAQEILQKLTGLDLNEIRFFHFKQGVDLAGIEALVSRSGYTGEDGFEIYIKASDATALWDKLLEAGNDYGLEPAGLGARDTLRFESAMPLYGQELSETISPLEAGLGRYVKLDKNAFNGKAALAAQLEKGLTRRLVGLELLERGVPRIDCEVLVNGRKAGYVTSGGFAPTLKKNLAMALKDTAALNALDAEGSADGSGSVQIVIRDKALNAGIVKLPFYNKKYKKG